MRQILKALLLGMCAFILAVVLVEALSGIVPVKLVGGFLEEGVKLAFVLLLARGVSTRKTIAAAGWIGVGFWLLETICFIPSGKFLGLRVLTLIGHTLWPMIGVSLSRRTNAMLGIVVAGALHQMFNFGGFVTGDGEMLPGICLLLGTLLISAILQRRLNSKLS